MNVGELLGPWLALAAVLVPLVFAERWIHSHLFGVAWLATNSTRSATALYYLLLFPGVFVHELTQYLVAGALNVPIQRVIAWPEAQQDGTLRLDFVRVQNPRRLSAAIIGAAPLLVGLGIVWLISSRVLDLDAVVQALTTGDWRQIGPALRAMVAKRDFFLWLYLAFAVSNAMLPTAADRRGWPLLLGLFAIILLGLALLGVGDVLLEVFTTSVALHVERLAAALGTVVFVEGLGILFIGVVERVLERATGRRFTYRREEQSARRQPAARQPGSSAPLPPGAPLPSIYNLDLPVPLPSDARRSAAPVGARPGLPTASLPLSDADEAADETPDAAAPERGFGPAPRSTAEFPPQTPGARTERGPLPTGNEAARPRPGLGAPGSAPQPPRTGERPPRGPFAPPPVPFEDDAAAERTSVGERTGFFQRDAPVERPSAAGLAPRRALPEDQPPAARLGRSLGTGRPAPLADEDAGDDADEEDADELDDLGSLGDLDDLEYVPFDDVDLS